MYSKPPTFRRRTRPADAEATVTRNPIIPENAGAAVPAFLQYRLRLFALGCGAQQAIVVEQPGCVAELVVTTQDGTRLTLMIEGPTWKWHQALDRMEELYEEQSEAGLHRFLGLGRAA